MFINLQIYKKYIYHSLLTIKLNKINVRHSMLMTEFNGLLYPNSACVLLKNDNKTKNGTIVDNKMGADCAQVLRIA